jgi:arginase family enzyme
MSGPQGGTRRSFPSKEDLDDGRKLSIKTYTILDAADSPALVAKGVSALKGKTYFSLDIDAADPSFALGTGTPEAGGLSSLQLIKFIRSIDLELVGMDVVEVSPPYDVSEITSMLAANLLYEGMSVLAATLE